MGLFFMKPLHGDISPLIQNIGSRSNLNPEPILSAQADIRLSIWSDHTNSQQTSETAMQRCCWAQGHQSFKSTCIASLRQAKKPQA